MAYSLSERFSSPPSHHRNLDPGAYQNVNGPLIRANKAPFLSNTPRHPQTGNKLWTHAIYNNSIPAKIVNCTALKSKVPRFPYESMSKEDFERLLCQCGIQNTCECPTGEDEKEEITECQGKKNRRIFKGPPSRPATVREFPSFKKKATKSDIPFYNTRVVESTSYYRGCKWSQRTSKRSDDKLSSTPGPGQYTLVKATHYETICAEKVRAYKRKISKQPRFIEMLQQQNLRDNLPGPGTYDPAESKGTNLNYLGPKAQRFNTFKYEVRPGPCDYWVKRHFDVPEPPEKFCIAELPSPAPFGSKAVRWKQKLEEGPSPATYNSKLETCKYVRCSKAPFGASSSRFKGVKKTVKSEMSYIDIDIHKKRETAKESDYKHNCTLRTWEFKSQTMRMKPLVKKFNEPSPADLPQSKNEISRSHQLQSVAPFFTSEERFQPWFNSMPIHNAENTPGPCYYSLEKPRCLSAVRRGPITRSPRFKQIKSQTPSPNKYQVGGGVENVLVTHNERLKKNMEKQHKFRWKVDTTKQPLNFEEKENFLINKCIALLAPNL